MKPPYVPAALAALLGLVPLRAQENGGVTESTAPAAPSESDFSALRKTSPFTRVLNLSETYALRGVATINREQVATLFNRETKKTVVITPRGDNEAGISLVEVTSAPQLDGVTAKISFAGDEAELRYETSQLYPEPKNQPGSLVPGQQQQRERRGPSPQDIERYKSLSPEKQAKFRDYMGHVMRSYPNISREERGNMMRGAMMRLIDGRELEVPSAPAGGQATESGSPNSESNRSSSRGGGDERSREGGSRRERR